MTDYDTLYPEIPQQSGENFRLHKVNMVLSQLGTELKHYEKVRKKYSRWRSFFHTSSVSTGSLSAILTVSGITTSLTDPGLIVGIPLSAIGGFLSAASTSCGLATKKLTKKVSKHEETIQLIKSKENTISDLVSKALHDNQIDEKEFSLIMSELQKYNTLKSEIRMKTNNNILKNNIPDVNKLREELKKELVDQLVNPKK